MMPCPQSEWLAGSQPELAPDWRQTCVLLARLGVGPCDQGVAAHPQSLKRGHADGSAGGRSLFALEPLWSRVRGWGPVARELQPTPIGLSVSDCTVFRQGGMLRAVGECRVNGLTLGLPRLPWAAILSLACPVWACHAVVLLAGTDAAIGQHDIASVQLATSSITSPVVIPLLAQLHAIDFSPSARAFLW